MNRCMIKENLLKRPRLTDSQDSINYILNNKIYLKEIVSKNKNKNDLP